MEKYSSRYTHAYQKNRKAGKKYDKKICNRFEQFIWDLEKHYLDRITEKYSGEDYLDFACGTGRIIEFLSDKFESSVGIDTARPMLQEAQKKVPDAQFITGNIVTEKVTDKTFDVITSFRLFLNLETENRVKILRSLRRLLKEDGILVINNHMNRYSIIGLRFWIAHKIFGRPLNRDIEEKGIINTMSANEVKTMLREAGYRIIEVHRFTVLPGRKNILLLPRKMLFYVERFLSKVPLINRLAKDQIYVCKKIERPDTS